MMKLTRPSASFIYPPERSLARTPNAKASRWYNPDVSPRCTSEEWETYLHTQPDAHLLQTPQWGSLKCAYGWEVVRVLGEGCGAQVLFRRLPLGFTLAYVPKGPLGNWLPALLPELDSLCRQKRSVALKIEPDEDIDPALQTRLRENGFLPSPHLIQPATTFLVDLRAEEDEILARMHQKTRYNIRLASRKGVSARPWNDLDAFGRMMQMTAQRDDFGVHVPAYYRRAYDLFHPSGACELFVAEYEDQPIAAIMIFARGSRAWYLYGASTDMHRSRMPTYLLQWQAIQWARQHGCTQYDLWGVPDEDQESLEANFMHRSDGLWGVYRFKRGFGGNLARSIGAWDRPRIPWLYWLYCIWMSRRNGRE
jgi:peptidoglycan pentaglycine glycine transferase (the first glycine)